MWATDHLCIRFELGRHGWSTLYLEEGDTRHFIRITHIFDDDPTESLIQFAEDIQNQSFPVRAIFHDEPGTHFLDLSVAVDRNPTLTLFRSPKNFQSIDKAEEVDSFEVVPSFIAAQIYAELQRTERLMSHKLYQKDRNYFPFRRFNQMKSKLSP